jgi:hypothetical protein
VPARQVQVSGSNGANGTLRTVHLAEAGSGECDRLEVTAR